MVASLGARAPSRHLDHVEAQLVISVEPRSNRRNGSWNSPLIWWPNMFCLRVPGEPTSFLERAGRLLSNAAPGLDRAGFECM